jgi:hypothetical protein
VQGLTGNLNIEWKSFSAHSLKITSVLIATCEQGFSGMTLSFHCASFQIVNVRSLLFCKLGERPVSKLARDEYNSVRDSMHIMKLTISASTLTAHLISTNISFMA